MTPPDDWAELRRLADGATPGPWRSRAGYRPDRFEPAGYRYVQFGPTEAKAKGLGTDQLSPANANFIAAANPKAVLALLDERDRLHHLAESAAIGVHNRDHGANPWFWDCGVDYCAASRRSLLASTAPAAGEGTMSDIRWCGDTNPHPSHQMASVDFRCPGEAPRDTGSEPRTEAEIDLSTLRAWQASWRRQPADPLAEAARTADDRLSELGADYVELQRLHVALGDEMRVLRSAADGRLREAVAVALSTSRHKLVRAAPEGVACICGQYDDSDHGVEASELWRDHLIRAAQSALLPAPDRPAEPDFTGHTRAYGPGFPLGWQSGAAEPVGLDVEPPKDFGEQIADHSDLGERIVNRAEARRRSVRPEAPSDRD